MKALFTLLLYTVCTINASAQNKETKIHGIDTTGKLLLADASCGQCMLGLKGKGCNLAVRIDGHAYFVDGSDIDSHGDAHADDGFCKKIRKAKVHGAVVDNRFKATYFELLPETTKKKSR
jgi:hypothetical protein